eukprot:m.67148 g.67148  ORF g.67148 m.67148 type:complete len:437 (+) comp11864_c0_seq1:147-1457(+)
MRMMWLIFLVLSMLIGNSSALNNGLGRTPPMGWSSWNTFVDVALNESVIREIADAIVENGLDKLGYKYVNVDCGWSAVNRGDDGKIIPDPTRFPSGMKALSDYIHSKGLLFGLYTARGVTECCGRVGYNGSAYAQRDANTFVSWGIDYLKVDSCANNPDSEETQWNQFANMRDALNKTGRPVYLSVCEIWNDPEPISTCHSRGIVYSPKMWLQQGLPVRELANSILVEYSNNGNTWESIACMIEAQENLTFSNLSAPGTWNDNDMLSTGCSDHHTNLPWTPCINKHGLTARESRTEFTFWVVTASPLILGNDLRYMSKDTLETISNKEVLAINQDSLGHRGVLTWKNNNGIIIHCKNMADKQKKAMSIINLNNNTQHVKVNLALCGNSRIPGIMQKDIISVRDVWQHKDLAAHSEELDIQLMGHEGMLLLVTFSLQ